MAAWARLCLGPGHTEPEAAREAGAPPGIKSRPSEATLPSRLLLGKILD